MQQHEQNSESLHRGLSVRGIAKSYSGVQVLSGIDLDVAPGEVVALIGENGAGKSTLSSIISGAVQPSAGNMKLNGKAYAPANPAEAIASGIGMIHQEMQLLPDLSIAENVFVGRLLTRNGFVSQADMRQRAKARLSSLGLDISPDTLVSTLRVAAQQQVEIAKSLELNARLLILDEPTATFGDQESELLFAQIDLLRNQGYSFLYISHRLHEIARIADRILVLRDGELVNSHPTATVPPSRLVEDMVGRNLNRMFPKFAPPREEIALEVRNLNSPDGRFSDINFKVRRGEVFCLAGLVGAGRTEILGAIGGAEVARGEIFIDGHKAVIRSPADAIRAGMAMVPEDRKALGAVLAHSVAENIALSNSSRFARSGWASHGAVSAFANRMMTKVGVRGRANQSMGTLSGGNQQKAIIAKWIAHEPRILILDEPTRGIDVGARASIYELISELANSGMAVVVASSDLEEVLGLAHRVAVVSRGRIRGILDRSEATQVTVMELATE